MINKLHPYRVYILIYSIITILIGVVLLWNSKVEIHLYLNQFHSEPTDVIFKYLTHLGDGFAIVGAVIIGFFFNKKFSVQIALSGILSGIIAQFFKLVVFGPVKRPMAYFEGLNQKLHLIEGVDMHTAFSFPSGHSTAAFTLATSIALYTKKPIYQIMILFSGCVIAYSRVYLSQHFLEDIFAGSIIGVLTALVVYWLISKSSFGKNPNSNNPLITI